METALSLSLIYRTDKMMRSVLFMYFLESAVECCVPRDSALFSYIRVTLVWPVFPPSGPMRAASLSCLSWVRVQVSNSRERKKQPQTRECFTVGLIHRGIILSAARLPSVTAISLKLGSFQSSAVKCW